MSYFPGIGITSPGRAMAPAAVEESASEIERSSLRLWLRGDELVDTSRNGLVYAWGSKAPLAPISLLTGATSPSVSSAAVNGHNAINFQTSGPVNASFNDSYLANMTEYTLIVVAKFNGPVSNVNALIARFTGNDFIFSLHAGAQKMALTYTNTAGSLNEAFSSTALDASQWGIYAVTAKTQIKFYLNGVADGTTAVTGSLGRTEPTGNKLYVGGNPNNSINYAQLIAEAIVYNKELTTEQLAPIFAELKERYAIE